MYIAITQYDTKYKAHDTPPITHITLTFVFLKKTNRFWTFRKYLRDGRIYRPYYTV